MGGPADVIAAIVYYAFVAALCGAGLGAAVLTVLLIITGRLRIG